jgi:hypothetical protein
MAGKRKRSLKTKVLAELGSKRAKDWGLTKPHIKDMTYEDLRNLHLAVTEAISDGVLPPPPNTCGGCAPPCTK